jgi:trehalose 6-phosphate synthase
LAVALGDALRARGGLWFGWSGRVVDRVEDAKLHRSAAGEARLATIDLTREEHEQHYRVYSNGVLWPVLHDRLDLADFDAGGAAGYARVNRRFADALRPLLRDDDTIWVHDFHLIPLASELRAQGSAHRIGFFLHVPVPPASLLAALPSAAALLRTFAAYDVVGLQTQRDVEHLAEFLVRELDATELGDDRFRLDGREFALRAVPIGIDVDAFQALGRAADAQEMLRNVREQYARRRLIVGIDRLDYTKGIPQRVRAFGHLLEHHPDLRRDATLIQVAAPSREDLGAYTDIRAEIESLVGTLNGHYGELDWMPVRYLRRAVARRRTPGLFAASRVALVTPLRDGMNLVAKEFVAAQDPADPGVLVLSRFAGAAERLTDAVLVNPYDAAATAEAIDAALRMPLAERRMRHEKLLARIRAEDVHWWSRTFLDALECG